MKLFLIFALVAVTAAPAFACPQCQSAGVAVNVQAAQSVGVVNAALVQGPVALRLTRRQRRQVTRNSQVIVGTGVATQAVVAQPAVVAPVAPPPPPAPVLAVPQGAQLQQAQPKRYQLVEVPEEEEAPAPAEVAPQRQMAQAPAKIHTFELVEQPQQYAYAQTYAAQQVYAYAQPAVQYMQTAVLPTFQTFVAQPAFTTFASAVVQPATAFVTGANVAVSGARLFGGHHHRRGGTTVKVRMR
jgi:hypothetical protein